LAIDAYRRQRLLQWLPLSGGAAAPDVEVIALDFIEVHRALDVLPLRYRIPLLLYACEGYSIAEVAKVLDLSPAAVKMRICRAREMFRQAYGPEERR
jgi:RNA polymerase sigma-70 factor (ECF subfamily)